MFNTEEINWTQIIVSNVSLIVSFMTCIGTSYFILKRNHSKQAIEIAQLKAGKTIEDLESQIKALEKSISDHKTEKKELFEETRDHIKTVHIDAVSTKVDWHRFEELEKENAQLKAEIEELKKQIRS